MSKILDEKIRNNSWNDGIATYVETENGEVFLVDTADTFDRGPETMVFPADKATLSVTDWGELYADWYENMDDAMSVHHTICENLENYI